MNSRLQGDDHVGNKHRRQRPTSEDVLVRTGLNTTRANRQVAIAAIAFAGKSDQS